MNFVEPIRDPVMVENIANYLKARSDRDYIMFLCGLYTGRRIGDILRLRVGDLKNRDCFTIQEQKTGKRIDISINPVLKKALKIYCADRDPDDFLIQSREGYNKAIDRTTAYRILNEAAISYGLGNIGTHTMRKTFGYFYYQQYKDIRTLMLIFNHSSENITKRYIGIEIEHANKGIKNLRILE